MTIIVTTKSKDMTSNKIKYQAIRYLETGRNTDIGSRSSFSIGDIIWFQLK